MSRRFNVVPRCHSTSLPDCSLGFGRYISLCALQSLNCSQKRQTLQLPVVELSVIGSSYTRINILGWDVIAFWVST